MSTGSRVEDAIAHKGVTVSFGAHFQASEQFDLVFKEGMALVERTASYLDGPGRKESKGLAPPVTVLYATESMRLTTRLLDLASWLLIRRALREGDIDETEARTKRKRLKLESLGRPAHTKGFTELPEGLRNLISESFALHDRIIQLDKAMTLAPVTEATEASGMANPVGMQLSMLAEAFGAKGANP